MDINHDKLSIVDWLAQEPPQEWVESKNGGQYLPVEIVKALLDYLDPEWGTTSFHHFFFQHLDGSWRCSGSVELQISFYKNGGNRNSTESPIERNIVGAATFDTKEYEEGGNYHFAQTLLSLAIVAAAKEIAPIFGKNLNRVVEENKINNTLKNLNLGNSLAK